MDTLHRIDYLIGICDQVISNDPRPMTLRQISGVNKSFLETYTKDTYWNIIKRARDFKSKAISICNYRCIQNNMFLTPRLHRHPLWNEVKQKLIEDQDTCILDMGCCLGSDLRFCLYLGCGRNQILGVDLKSEFINLGFEFFGDKELEDRFMAMDVLKNEGKPFIESALQKNGGKRFDVLNIGNLYHLLGKGECALLTRIASELVVKEGGIVIGGAVGCEEEGVHPSKGKEDRYLYSEKSFEIMLRENGTFKEVVVEKDRPAVQRMTRFREPKKDETHYTYFKFHCKT